MWFILPAVIGVGTYFLAKDSPIFRYSVLIVCGGTVLVSAIGTPAAGVSYLFITILILIGLIFLRYFIPILAYIVGGAIGLMFVYYTIIGLGQLASQLP